MLASRLRSSLSLCLVLALASPAWAAPGFRALPDTLRGDENGDWSVRLELANPPGGYGIFVDSLLVEHASLDPDRSRRPARHLDDMSGLTRAMASVSAGETTGTTYGGVADFDRGTLGFRLMCHDAQGHRFVLTTSVVVAGNALSEAHPPITIEAKGQRTDMVLLPALDVTGPAPTVLYVPPAGVSARSLMRWAGMLRGRGYHVAIMSLPGAGRSSVEWDAAGPATTALVSAAVARLRQLPGVTPERIAVWGEREGGTAALLAGATTLPVNGIIAVDPDLDPWASHRASTPDAQAAYVAAAGRDSSAWRLRSPLLAAERIGVPVAIVQSREAVFKDPGPAEAFAQKRLAKDLFVETRLSAREPRPLLRNDVQRIVLGFLGRRLGQ